MVRLPRRAPDGRQREINAEGEGGGCEECFELVDHGAQVGGGVAEAADCAEAAGRRDGGGEGRGGCVGHTSEEDRVLNVEEGCEGGCEGGGWRGHGWDGVVDGEE